MPPYDDYPMPMPRISLEWNPSQQQIVAKQSLIGLPWSSLRSSSAGMGNIQRLSKYLADVIEVPDEIFALENLQEVLSVQTWNSCLSDVDRRFLYRYLPEGCDIEETLTDLLDCRNFFFGNPVTLWGERVCSGALHPDLIIKQQAAIHNERKSYYLSLRMYHQMMIQNLQQLRDLWKTSKTRDRIRIDTERWLRSRKPAALTLQQHHHPENGGIRDDAEAIVSPRQRLKRRREPPAAAAEKTNPAAEQAMNEWCKAQSRGDGDVSSSDARRIMVTRKQFAEIASRKLTGTDIRIDSLKDLLSSPTRFQAPEELFKSYWHNLAVGDLPEAYRAFRERFSRRKELAMVVAKLCLQRCSRFEENLPGAVISRSRASSLLPTPCSVSSSSSSRLLAEKPNGRIDAAASVNSHSLLYYQRVGVATAEDDELASIQELWSYNCLQDAPIHL